MIKIDSSTFKYLPFAALGPAITSYLIWQGKSQNPNVLLPAILISAIPIAITAIAAFIMRKIYPRANGITGRTVGLSFLITITAIVVPGYRNPWFSMIIIIAPLYAAPTLLSFSIFWANIFSFVPEPVHAKVSDVSPADKSAELIGKSWQQKSNGLKVSITFAMIHLCLVLLAYLIKITSPSTPPDFTFLWFGYLDAPLLLFLPRSLFKTFGSLAPLLQFGIIGSTFWFLFTLVIANIYTRLFTKSIINKSRQVR